MPDRFASGKVTNAFENRVESKFADKQDKVCEEVETLRKEWDAFNDANERYMQHQEKFEATTTERLYKIEKYINDNNPINAACYNLLQRIIVGMIKHPFLMWLNYKFLKLYDFCYTDMFLPNGKRGFEIVAADRTYAHAKMQKNGRWVDYTYKSFRENRNTVLKRISKHYDIPVKVLKSANVPIRVVVDGTHSFEILDKSQEVFKYG